MEIRNKMKEIMDIDVPILNIGNRTGITGYLDFIKKTEISENVVKGKDCFNREFIVFKSTITYNDGSKIETFTILFQRYQNDKFVWMTCGHDGPYVFDTIGGIKIDQVLFLDTLLKKKYFIVDVSEQENKYRLYEHENILNVPIRIDLGYY
jgi:hypothetical protein